MRINIISDLHGCTYRYDGHFAEFLTGFDPSKLEKSDVLVVAGDLGSSCSATKDVYYELKKYENDKFKYLLYIKGNHDFYYVPSFVASFGYIYDKKDNDPMNCRATISIIGDVAFICLPLWSPIKNEGRIISRYVNDYILIPGYTIEENNKLFEKQVNQLVELLDFCEKHNSIKKVVIVSHHVPLIELINEKYANSILNEAFCVMHPSEKHGSIKDIVKKYDGLIKAWIHGHSHSYCDKTIDGVRYIRNPIGYALENGKNECDFKYDCIIDV